MVSAGEQKHVPPAACRRKLSTKAIRIDARRLSAILDQMSEDALDFVSVLDDGDDLHVRSALATCHRIYLVDLSEKAGPGALEASILNLRQYL